jgi:dGTPase
VPTLSGLRARRREERELQEEELLSPIATRSTASRGRTQPEEPDEYRTSFERDRDRVIHSKAFRRLKHKTQVFLNPEGDHYVTRLTHTMHVAQIGRAMAAGLALNEALTEAICLAHDVGHSPFGHTGEDALTPFVDGEWLHSAQGVRVLSILEPLNLSWEVLDGVRAHSWKIAEPPATPEGDLCRYADRIAYLTHDVSDAIRAGVITYADLPGVAVELGHTARQWIGTMVTSVIEDSARIGTVRMDDSTLEVMNEVRDFMFQRVYLGPEMEDPKNRAIRVIRDLVEYFAEHPNSVPETYKVDDADDLIRAIDYVAGMTDRFAIRTHDSLFRPTLFD